MQTQCACNIGSVYSYTTLRPWLNRLFGAFFLNVYEANDAGSGAGYYFAYPTGRGLATADDRWHIKDLPNTRFIDGNRTNNTFYLPHQLADQTAIENGEYVFMWTDDNIGLRVVNAFGDGTVTLGAFSRAQELMLYHGVMTLTWINRQVITIANCKDSILRVASVAVGGGGTSSCRKTALVLNDGVEPALWLAGQFVRPDYIELHRETKLIRTHDICGPSNAFYMNYGGGVEGEFGKSCLPGAREAEVETELSPDGVISGVLYVPRDSGEAGMSSLYGPETVARIAKDMNYAAVHQQTPLLLSDAGIHEWYVRFHEINPVSQIHAGNAHNEIWNRPGFGRCYGTGRMIASRLGLTAYYRGETYPVNTVTTDGSAVALAGMMYKWGVSVKACRDVRGTALTVPQVECVDFDGIAGEHPWSYCYGFGSGWQFDQKPYQLDGANPQQDYTVAQILDDTVTNGGIKSKVCFNAYIYPFREDNTSYSTDGAAIVADGGETWTDQEWHDAFQRCATLLETYYAYQLTRVPYYFPNGGVEFSMYECAFDLQFLMTGTAALRARVAAFMQSKKGVELRCNFYKNNAMGRYRYMPYYYDINIPYGWTNLVPVRTDVPPVQVLCHRSAGLGRGATFNLALAAAQER